MLSELGRCNEALEATREAVQLGRELVQANPQAFLSDLAMNLNTLGAMFSEMGNHDEALPAAQEAVQLYRNSS
jgi:tetratricopeptide (TPR) repeat protein